MLLLSVETHNKKAITGYKRRASSHELSVPRTRLSTYGDRAFPVVAVLELEQSSAARHIRAVTSRLLHSLEDILLRTVLFIKLLSCLRSDIVILDTLIVQLIYLLTYKQDRKALTSDPIGISLQRIAVIKTFY